MNPRREFLKASLAASGVWAWGLSAPRFLAKSAAAAPDALQPGGNEKILVVVQLTGGNDGLNTVVPFGDDGYGRLRNKLRLPKNELLKVNDHIGLHPSLTGLAKLLEQQALSIVQGVGYPNPNESHFRSMDIWQAASLGEDLTEGWLGKSLVQLPGVPAFHAAAPNESSHLALAGAPARVPSITNLAQFQLQMNAAGATDREAQRSVIESGTIESGKGRHTAANASYEQNRLLDFVCRTATNTYANSRRLQELAKNYQPATPYPTTGLANRLKLVAQLIESGIGGRIYYVTQDGYDTHAGQLPLHANLLKELGDAVAAFYQDLSARGHRDRLLLMTFSEFGRRAKENESGGTDHGSAEPLFFVGGRVKPGLIGKHPSLTDLEMDKLKHHTDFRQVYASVLDNWLGVSSEKVLGEKFKPLDFLKT